MDGRAIRAFYRRAELWSDRMAAKRVRKRIFERILLVALQSDHVPEPSE